MSSLNLTPNPTVVVIEAALFATSLFIIKKLMLDPYLKVRAKRDSATTGSKDDAAKLIQSADQLSAEITRQTQEAHSNIKKQTDSIRLAASTKRSQIVGAAEKAAKDELAKLQAELQSNLKEQRAKLGEIAKTLGKQFADQTLS